MEKIKEIKIISATNTVDFNRFLEQYVKNGYSPLGELIVNTCYDEGDRKVKTTYSMVIAKY